MASAYPGYKRKSLLILSLLLFILGAGCSGKPLMVSLLEKSIPEDVEPLTARAEVIQANTDLFKSSMKCDHPAQVAFSLDPNMSQADLKKFAKFAFSLKGTVLMAIELPGDSDEKRLARQVTNENFVPDRFWKVPRSLCGNDSTYIAGVWIEREKLSEGYIKKGASLECQFYLVDGAPNAIRFVRDVE